MKVKIELINERGRPLSKRSRASRYDGDFRMHEERVQSLGRAVVTAKLLSDIDGMESPVIPMLYDASMIYVRDAQIRVRGFELVDGVQYGQTWDIKVV